MQVSQAGLQCGALRVQKRFSGRTKRIFRVTAGKMSDKWWMRAPAEPYSVQMRYGPDKGFFHRDNVRFNSAVNNPWGFLYPGGRVQSPLWQSDEGIGSHEVAGDVDDKQRDTAAYQEKLHHNHPELKFDLKPTPFGQYDFDFSLRTGLLAVKVGKSTWVDDYGNMCNVYALWVPEQHVVAHFTEQNDGFNAVEIAALNTDKGNPDLGARCVEAGVPLKRISKAFPVSEDAFIPIGTKLDVRHFVPGQLTTAVSRSVQRGFQGVMSRWGFKGGPTQYGPRRSRAWHRRPGSLARGEAYGKIWKGACWAGHTGGLKRTTSGYVQRVDAKNQMVYVAGPIAGPMGQLISLSDSTVRKFDFFFGAPPFPTYVPAEGERRSKMKWEEAQAVARSRIGYPRPLRGMPSPEVLESYNYAAKQKVVMEAEGF